MAPNNDSEKPASMFERISRLTFRDRLVKIGFLLSFFTSFAVATPYLYVKNYNAGYEEGREQVRRFWEGYKKLEVASDHLDALSKQLSAVYGQFPISVEQKFSIEKTLAMAQLELANGRSSLLELYKAEGGYSFNLVGTAQAQPASEVPQYAGAVRQGEILRPGIMVFVIGAITLFGGFCVFLYFKSDDPEKLKFADNMLRTIVGFYIGIVTGLLGIPPAA